MKKYTVIVEYNYGKVRTYETDQRPKMVNDAVVKINEEYLNLVNVGFFHTIENT